MTHGVYTMYIYMSAGMVCRRHYMCLTAGERSVTRGPMAYTRMLPLVGCISHALHYQIPALAQGLRSCPIKCHQWVAALAGVGYWAANAALFLYPFSLYPCCGRITASLRGPNIIKLLCSFGANAGICRWECACAARGEYVSICGCVGWYAGGIPCG